MDEQQRLNEIAGLSQSQAQDQLLGEIQKATTAGLQSAQSTMDIPGASDGFEVNVPDGIDVADLDGTDNISDIQSRLDKTTQRKQELAMASQEELDLSNRIAKEDLSTEKAKKELFGQGFNTPLALLQGEERKIAADRQFNRGFDMLELQQLENSRQRELQVASGEITQLQAEAEQIAEVTKNNDTIIENMAKLFQGTNLQELSTGNPETYQKLVNAAANSNYSLGEIEQALKVEEKAPRTQITEVNGRKVLVNLDTGETISNLGAARTSSGSTKTVKDSDAVLETIANNVPGMVKSKAERYMNQLLSRGVAGSVIEQISSDFPEYYEDFEVQIATLDQVDPSAYEDIARDGFMLSGDGTLYAFSETDMQSASNGVAQVQNNPEPAEVQEDNFSMKDALNPFAGAKVADKLRNWFNK